MLSSKLHRKAFVALGFSQKRKDKASSVAPKAAYASFPLNALHKLQATTELAKMR